MVRVFNAVAVSTHQINNKSVVPHHATVGWQCWGESIRFNHARGRAWTEWCVFPMPWQ